MKSDNPIKSLFLLMESRYTPIYQVQEVFIAISPQDLHDFYMNARFRCHHYHLQLLYYFLTLFRNVSKIQLLLQSPEIHLELTEDLFINTFGRFVVPETITMDQLLDEYFPFIPQDRMLALLTTSRIISRDALFSYFILTKLDRHHIDTFFAQKQDLDRFINSFLHFSQRMARKILLRNPTLFGYIVMYLQVFQDAEAADAFNMKFAQDIKEMEEIKNIIAQVSQKSRTGKQVTLGRFAFPATSLLSSTKILSLIPYLSGKKNLHRIVYFLEKEGIFEHDAEKKMVLEILSNPLFRDIVASTAK